MKTNEVEKETGLSKQTILYYEKEGLITPQRDQNDYRNYSDHDVQILLLIKLLRSMNVGIDDIRLVMNKQLSIQDCLNTQSAYIQNHLKVLQSV